MAPFSSEEPGRWLAEESRLTGYEEALWRKDWWDLRNRQEGVDRDNNTDLAWDVDPHIGHPKAHACEKVSSTGWGIREYVSSTKSKCDPALRCLSASAFSLVGVQKGLNLEKISRGWHFLSQHLLLLHSCGSLDREDKGPSEDSQVMTPARPFPSLFVPSPSTMGVKSTPSGTERNSHATSPSSTC